ncbi:MAG: hypothetical protein KatS3mg088_684 [Patescibacteria group bacterium]|nr:MAG: hypothetical protein KatS3mg088_684 [Patescibacteria group bacterium]
MKNNGSLLIFLFILVFSALLLSLKNYFDMRSLYCDLIESVMVERRYIYPILSKIDDPMRYGSGGSDPDTKDLKNPITTKEKYFKYCK